jgi:hypothetical protein
MQPSTCPRCQDLQANVSFDYSDAERFKSFHEILSRSVRRGELQLDEGDLQWSDEIECVLHCPRCGKRFRLNCETLHGRGGRWQPEDGR